MKAFVALLLLGLALPATAAAHTKTLAPPGNSAISQYVEVIPTAKGGRPSGGLPSGSGGGGGGGQQALSSATERAFAKQGAVGVKAAALANATSPGGRAPAHSSQNGSGQPANAGASGGAGNGSAGDPPASSLAKVLTGSAGGGGLGILLPGLLVIIAIAGGVIALARARRSA